MKAKLWGISAVFCIVFLAAAFPVGAQQEVPGEEKPALAIETVQAPPSGDTNLPLSPATNEKVLENSEQPPDAAPDPGEQESPESGVMDFLKRLGIVLGVLAGQAVLIWLIWLLFKRLAAKAEKTAEEKIKPIRVKKVTLLNTRQIEEAILGFLKICKYCITFIQLYLTLPIIFSLFPATKDLASTLFGYILDPLESIVVSTVKYIPNLITIIIIILIVRYLVRVLKFFAVKIALGKLEIQRFHPDLAEPTFNILRFLLWAFAFALVYPYLPGSHSQVFQGVSVFVGVIFSLGSTSAIGNLVAGLVITYMRSFRVGDRVKIKETIGFVVEKNLMVVRLRTHKNEYVTFPNLTILSSEILNYNSSSEDESEGLILNTEVTFSYATPWKTVHEILIHAALATEHILKTPEPFVLQTGMDDFYARYQINCYTKEIEKVPAIYAHLYENIQNGFRDAGIDMTCAHYGIITSKNAE